MVILKDQSESKYSSYAGTVTYGLDASTTAFFCLYITKISRNAIAYLHFVNVIGILCMITIILVCVESPKYLLSKSEDSKAIRSLNQISKINHLFKSPYVFPETIKIFLSK